MTPSEYQRVSDIFAAACELEAEKRSAFLDDACAGDAGIRAQVESMLRSDAEGESFMRDAAMNLRGSVEGALHQDDPTDSIPARIGRYQVIRKLGDGGMGIVYLAEQDQPRRHVAVKVIRTSFMSREMVRRFEFEARVLGKLRHPGIAHIYESGTTDLDGRECAFFAMEYIDGLALTKYAEAEKLDPHRRLELIASICDAVQHAHEQGVVHRDLKPGNILVDSSGRPRVLDFGVSRAVNSDVTALTLRTDVGQLIGTLQYMSPEQVGGIPGDLDARSDVYALGVVAFELLTGSPPYDVREMTVPQIARTIQEVEPTRLGLLNPAFRGDVETVLSKALEKEKSRRYATAADFAADIRRYLDRQPIVARPATTMYRIGKFAERNKMFVAGVIIAFAALLSGFVVSTVMYLKADRARMLADDLRRQAEREAARAGAINSFLVDDLLAAPNPWNAGRRSVTVAEVLDRASAQVEKRFGAEPELEASIRTTLGESYQALGLYEKAQPHLAGANSIRSLSSSPDWGEMLKSEQAEARNLLYLGRTADADQACDKALKSGRELFRADSIQVANALETQGEIRNGQGRFGEAEALFRESLKIHQLHDRADPLAIPRLSNLIGSALYYGGKYADAEKLKLESLAGFRACLGDHNPYVAQVLNELGVACAELKRYDDAQRYYEQALPMLKEYLGPEHSIVLTCQRSLASAESFSGRDDLAEPLLLSTIAVSERTLGSAHPDSMAAANCLATLYLRAQRVAEASKLLQSLLERSEKSLGARHVETLKYASNLAWCEFHQDHMEAAEHLFRRAVSGFEHTLGADHPNTLGAIDGLAQLLDADKKWAESATWKQRLVDAQKATGAPEDMDFALLLNRLGTSYLMAGDYAAARPPLTRCVEICKQNLPAGDWRTAIGEGKLGDCLSHLGLHEQAEEQLSASLETFRTNTASPPGNVEAALNRLIAHYERSNESDKAAAFRAELAATTQPSISAGD